MRSGDLGRRIAGDRFSEFAGVFASKKDEPLPTRLAREKEEDSGTGGTMLSLASTVESRSRRKLLAFGKITDELADGGTGNVIRLDQQKLIQFLDREFV